MPAIEILATLPISAIVLSTPQSTGTVLAPAGGVAQGRFWVSENVALNLGYHAHIASGDVLVRGPSLGVTLGVLGRRRAHHDSPILTYTVPRSRFVTAFLGIANETFDFSSYDSATDDAVVVVKRAFSKGQSLTPTAAITFSQGFAPQWNFETGLRVSKAFPLETHELSYASVALEVGVSFTPHQKDP